MEIYSHPDIPEILSIDGNSICCDCGAQKPKWASLNNGIFLCLKCAGVHRSYGLNISLIRSLQIDSWTDEQILYLSKGGNNRFKMNLIEFQIDQNTPNEKKYKSKAADYYRKFLKNDVDKTMNPNYIPIQLTKPEISQGKELINIKENEKTVNNSNLIGSNNPNQQKNNSFFGLVGSFFNTVKETAVETANTVSKGIDELGIKEKLKNASDTVVQMAKTGGNYIADKTQEAYNSDLVQGIAKTAESGINTVIEKTKTLLNNDNKNEQLANGEMSSLVMNNNVNNNVNANLENNNNNINDAENNNNINADAENNKNNLNDIEENNKNNLNDIEENNNINNNIDNKVDDKKEEQQQPTEEEKK